MHDTTTIIHVNIVAMVIYVSPPLHGTSYIYDQQSIESMTSNLKQGPTISWFLIILIKKNIDQQRICINIRHYLRKVGPTQVREALQRGCKTHKLYQAGPPMMQ